MKSLACCLVLAVVACLCDSASAGGKTPLLAGTKWQLLSLTEKNEKITDAQTPAIVHYTGDGKWTVSHYGGRVEAGNYKVDGNKIVMRNETGELYYDGTMSVTGSILEIRSGKYLMRLRAVK